MKGDWQPVSQIVSKFLVTEASASEKSRSGRGYERIAEGGVYRLEEARLAAATKLLVIPVSAFSI